MGKFKVAVNHFVSQDNFLDMFYKQTKQIIASQLSDLNLIPKPQNPLYITNGNVNKDHEDDPTSKNWF